MGILKSVVTGLPADAEKGIGDALVLFQPVGLLPGVEVASTNAGKRTCRVSEAPTIIHMSLVVSVNGVLRE